MADYSHILFNKSPSQLRLLGARGGRAYGRNRRRRALLPAPPEAITPHTTPQETTAEAVAVLDTRFPWLRLAEKRLSRNHRRRSGPADSKDRLDSRLFSLGPL
jgi:hypothetical protein